MHRRLLLDMLDAYARVYPAEVAMIERIGFLVRSHADCFERTCRPGHVTASAWILSADRRRCLLTHHRFLNRWLQLGGHADGQWDPIDVAVREVREESSLDRIQLVRVAGCLIPFDIDIHRIPARYDAAGRLLEDAHEHHDIRFLFITDMADDMISKSAESHAIAWHTPAEIHERTQEESILRMLWKSTAWMM
ncbi:MAG: NUDIX hydrolase [Pirellulales bacterium]|nr:NUDIX hydrolase [Pirellulales bacterium]